MKTYLLIWLFFLGLCISQPVHAANWWDKVPLLNYSPRYFGPNAFPFPELMGGELSSRWEVEVRGEYHKMPGDKTKDVFARLYIPIAKGRAGVTLSGVFQEWYKTSPEVRDERNAVETKSPIPCHGDFILGCHYQVLKSEKWVDIVANATLRTASGGRLCDARYTDAAAYWFDCNIGRTLWQDPLTSASLRVQGMAGFYCWMTNDLKHRQNDALCYGLGVQGTFRSFSLDVDYSGIKGYRGDGDKPMIIRSKLNYELKKNIISFRYKHGIQDYLYNTISLAYIRCF
ncbi:hypothetical protein [Parabacteroides sp.]